MKINGVTRAFVLLFVALTSTSDFVESHRPCVDPHAYANEPKLILPIKAAPAPRPTCYASETAINQAAEAREHVAQAMLASSHCGCSAHAPPAKEAQNLLSLGSNIRVAPRFEPTGDLCHGPLTPHAVTPANPGKIKTCHYQCPHCTHYAHGSHGPHGPHGPYGPHGPRGPSGPHGPHGHGHNCGCHRRHHEPIVTYGSIATPPCGPSEHGGHHGYAGQGYAAPYGGGKPVGVPSAYTSLSPSSQSYNVVAGPADAGMPFEEQESIYNGIPMTGIPADAVSLSLAYKNILAPRFGLVNMKKFIPEERLSYGPRTPPTDGRVQQTPTTTVPEERLFTVDKPIVELKPPTDDCGHAIEEYDAEQEAAMESERQEQAEAAQVANGASNSVITYGDLGYAPIGPSPNKFVERPSPRFYVSSGIPCGPAGKPLPDYRSGQVIVKGLNHDGSSCSEDSHGADNEKPYDVPVSYKTDEPSVHENQGYTLYHGNKPSDSSIDGVGLLSRLWGKAAMKAGGYSH